MSKQIFKHTSPNSFRLHENSANALNEIFEDTPIEKLSDAIAFLASEYNRKQKPTESKQVAPAPLYYPPALIEFQKEVEAALPGLYPLSLPDGEIELTPADVILLMVDYCKRDPSNEFPFGIETEKVIARYKTRKNEQTGTTEERKRTAGQRTETPVETEGTTAATEPTATNGAEPITTDTTDTATEATDTNL